MVGGGAKKKKLVLVHLIKWGSEAVRETTDTVPNAK